MKTKNSITLMSFLALTVILSACGKTTRTASYSGGSSSNGSTVTNTNTNTNTWTYTDTGTNTNTNTNTNTGTAPALSYEFSANGNQAIATGNITTDNVLKVRFKVTAEQGNHVWKATELKVTLAVNGTEVTPTYTSNNYTYGRVGETSNVIDLSSYVSPGVPLSIVAKLPKNDFYCTYWAGLNYDGSYVNPQYNSYPGCRKEVFTNHKWSGIIMIQTSSTVSI